VESSLSLHAMASKVPVKWHLVFCLCVALVQETVSFTFADQTWAISKAVKQGEALWKDCTMLDKAHVETGKDPLVAACDSRPVFKQYLLALRHLLALVPRHLPGGGSELDRFLAVAGELDLELGQLTSSGRVQPFYFWHGPKRHVPSKFQELLDTEVGGRKVRQLLSAFAQDERPAITSSMSLPELGLSYPTAARPVNVLPSAAVHLNGAGDACAVGAASVDAGIRHLIVSGPTSKKALQPCLDARLQVTWDISEIFSDLFNGESQTPLQDIFEHALKSLNRASVDAIGLPPKAWFDKKLKGYVAQVVSTFRKAGKIKAVALVGAVPSKQLEKVLRGSLIPSFWLVPHDDCAPIGSNTLRLADESNLRIIGFGVPCGPLMEYVAGKESLDATSLLGRWTAELGLAVALPHSVSDLSATLKRIQEASPLSSSSWRLLSSTPSLSRTAALAVAPDFEDSFGLRAVIERATQLATGDLASTSVPAVTSSLNKQTWANLEDDKAKFDDNHFIIYKENFLSPEKYSLVKNEAARLWSSNELEPNCNLDGRDRTGGYVLDTLLGNSSLYELFYGDDEFRRWVSRINGHQMFPSDFPVELREYPSGSSGMPCHRDLLMYTNATLDLEFVYTIDNVGTCISTFMNRRGETTEVHTGANSLIMVRPNAAYHCVKPSEHGHRTILKFIYVGDYRKSSEFGFYTTNECGEDNPNNQAVLARRQQHLSAEL